MYIDHLSLTLPHRRTDGSDPNKLMFFNEIASVYSCIKGLKHAFRHKNKPVRNVAHYLNSNFLSMLFLYTKTMF